MSDPPWPPRGDPQRAERSASRPGAGPDQAAAGGRPVGRAPGAAHLRPGVLAPHRLRGLPARSWARSAEPARRDHRPAVPRARLLPRRRGGQLRLRLRRTRRPGSRGSRRALAAADRRDDRRGAGRRARRADLQPGRGPAAGIYLGVASWRWCSSAATCSTPGPRSPGASTAAAPEFSLFGFTFGNRDPELFVLGVPFREAERLWYLGLVLALAAYCSRGTCCAAGRAGRCRPCGTARWRRRHGRQRPGLQGAHLPGQLDVRRPRGRHVRLHRQHRPSPSASRSRSSTWP